MRVVNRNTPRIVTPAEMKDGEIGVIINWEDRPDYIGIVVQRHENILVTLGEEYGHSWTEADKITRPLCQIEILPKGTTLEI